LLYINDSTDDLGIVQGKIPFRFNMGFFDEAAGGILKNVFSVKIHRAAYWKALWVHKH
jgi:hypothetical protein